MRPRFPLCAALIAVVLSVDAAAQDGAASQPAKAPAAIYEDLRAGRFVAADVDAFLTAIETEKRIFATEWWTRAAEAAAKVPKADPALQRVAVRARKRLAEAAKYDSDVRLALSQIGSHVRALIDKKAPNEAKRALGALEVLTINFTTEARRIEFVDLRGRIERLRVELRSKPTKAPTTGGSGVRRSADEMKEEAAEKISNADRERTTNLIAKARAPVGTRPEQACDDFLTYGHPGAYDSVDTILKARSDPKAAAVDVRRVRAHARTLGAERAVVLRLAANCEARLVAEAGRDTPLGPGEATSSLAAGVTFTLKALPGEYVGVKLTIPAAKVKLITRSGDKHDYAEALLAAEVDGKPAAFSQWQAAPDRALERSKIAFGDLFVSDMRPGSTPKKNDFGIAGPDYHPPTEASDDYLVMLPITLKEALDVIMGKSNPFKDTTQPRFFAYGDDHRALEKSFGSKASSARWFLVTSSAPLLVFIVPRLEK